MLKKGRLAVWVLMASLVAGARLTAHSPAPATSTEAAGPPPQMVQRQDLTLSSVYVAPEFPDVLSGASTTGIEPSPRPVTTEEPDTRREVREPDPPLDAGVAARTNALASARTDGTITDASAAGSIEGIGQALLEQARAQTAAQQALLAQQQAQEQARAYEQQARIDRDAVVQDARGSIDGTAQALQTTGDWDPASLSQTSASLRRTAASATTSGAVNEAARANDAARMVDAARAALAERNAQQAKWYLARASQLLGE
ncbi:MAG TPA: hypothetical protein VGG91_21680 [Myxococcaceae bacterium]